MRFLPIPSMAKHKGKKREWTEHSLSLLYQIQEFRFPNPQLYVYTRFVNPVAFATLFDAIRIAFLDTQAGNCSFYLIEYYIKSEHSYWNSFACVRWVKGFAILFRHWRMDWGMCSCTTVGRLTCGRIVADYYSKVHQDVNDVFHLQSYSRRPDSVYTCKL